MGNPTKLLKLFKRLCSPSNVNQDVVIGIWTKEQREGFSCWFLQESSFGVVWGSSGRVAEGLRGFLSCWGYHLTVFPRQVLGSLVGGF